MGVRFGKVTGACFAALLALVLAPPAWATFTIGSNLSDPFANTLNCNAFATGCTASFGLGLPAASAAPNGLASPANGIVVRWRVKSGASPSLTALRILRPGNSVTRGAVTTSEAGMPNASAVSEFPTRLPIAAGDQIGIDSKFPPFASLAGTEFRYWAPTLVDGAPASGSTAFANSVLLINADIELDQDADGYGDETQDLCPREATEHEGCVLTVNVGPGGTVTGPGIDCPGDCTEAYPSTTTVDLTATPDPGFGGSFDASSGCLGPVMTDCQFLMANNRTVSASFLDNTPPNTTITKAPKRRSTKAKIKIKFTADDSDARFQCALDTDHFRSNAFCNSPFKDKVEPGKHTFLVRAAQALPGDLVDETPAKAKFRVLPKH